MAERIPLVLVAGVHRQIDPADTIPPSNLPVATPLVQGAMSTAQAAQLAAFTQAQADLVGLGAKSTIALTTIATPAGSDTLIGVPTMGTKTVTEMGGLGAVAAYVTANSTCDCTLVGTALVITAKAYGPACNGTVIGGTMLAAPGTMAGGLPPQVSPTTALATAQNPGTISSDCFANLALNDVPATGTVPAFVANAATIAPGTDLASRYAIESARTLAAAAALTISTAGTPVVGNKIIACYALALGYVLSVVNGGPLANTLGAFPASLTKPRGIVVYWDGTNYKFNGYVELTA
jgi:hypothetical protein